MSIKDLITKHEAILKRAPQEIDAMQARFDAAIINFCRLWFGDTWDEVAVSKIDKGKSTISVYITYEGATLEIRFSLNVTPKVITGMGEYPLPTLAWGRERFPTPVKETLLAQIFFEAQLSSKEA